MDWTAGAGAPAARGRARAAREDPNSPISDWAEAGFDDTLYRAAPPAGPSWITALHAAGALASLALVVGIGVWGYGQVMRDVSGVPVVEALDGPMRVAPDTPGGQISDHAGLAVNAVKAGGPAEEPPERLRLAPAPVDLAEEDRPAPELGTAERGRSGTAPAAAAAEGLLPVVEARLELPGGTAGGTAPGGEAPSPSAGTQPRAAQDRGAAGLDDAVEQAVQLALASGPGIARSLRPAPRPRSRPVPTAATADGPADLAPVPEGTRLVQLGAFDTAEEARAAWARIADRFSPLLADKGRVLQQAEAGGRGFWRLRARGFDDLAHARRFCAALVAQRADCIPVRAR